MVEQATEKSKGDVPGHLKEAINELNKPTVYWRAYLKNLLGTHVGNRRKTYSRRNRRNDRFGVPGISHHAAGKVSVVIDTSGSISKEDLSQFMGEIESICHRAKVSVLQWDHAFQGFSASYRRGDWKKFEVHGRGGTDMVAPVEWLEEKGLIGDCMVMLTDGYCSWPNQKSFPTIWAITTDEQGPDWGTIVRVKSHR